MPYLTKDQILSAQDLDKTTVDVPKWGGTVGLRMWTASERERLEKIMAGKDRDDIRATVVAYSVVDEDGKLLFSAEDVKALSQKSAAAVSDVFDASCKLNALSKQDVDELEKN